MGRDSREQPDRQRRLYFDRRRHRSTGSVPTSPENGPRSEGSENVFDWRNRSRETNVHIRRPPRISPSLSDALLSNEPFTQRRKRDLLVASTEAIDRRERFREALDDERDSLQTTADELSEIEATIDTLPELAPQHQPLEMLIVIWEGYETIEESCAELLTDCQRQLEGTDQNIRRYGTTHAFNRYLYGNLESVYPVLSALAATLRLLDSKRNREASPEVAEGSL